MITMPANYTPFVRKGSRIIPTWFQYEIGDVKYNIAEDGFSICIMPCREIGVKMEEAAGEPDFGFTAREQGLPDATDNSHCWGKVPQWIANLGISANELSDFIKAHLPRVTL